MVGKKSKKSWENNKNYLKTEEKECLVYNKQRRKKIEKRKERIHRLTDKILQTEKVGLEGVEVANTEK